MAVIEIPTSFLRTIPAYDAQLQVTVGYLYGSGYFFDVFEASAERPLTQVGMLSLRELVEQTRGVVNWTHQRALYLNLMADRERLDALHNQDSPAFKTIMDMLGS